MAQVFTHDENDIFYPESDDEPMAENTRQYRYIVLVKEGLEALYVAEPNIFIAADLFWYPVKGKPGIRYAPDVLVAIGRPKGDRRSYQQWLEENVAPQVVFEILSPSNRGPELEKKRAFYQKHGVVEYYEYDPDDGSLRGWQRQAGVLEKIEEMRGWISPLLKIRFELDGIDLKVYRPDQRPFVSPIELEEMVVSEHKAREQAEQRTTQTELWARYESQRADDERKRADDERKARLQAEEQAHTEKEQLWAKLREIGIDPESLTAR